MWGRSSLLKGLDHVTEQVIVTEHGSELIDPLWLRRSSLLKGLDHVTELVLVTEYGSELLDTI